MKWAYGITTVPSRGDNLLPQTVESLAKAGFNEPILFIDGMAPNWVPPCNTLRGLVFNEPAIGHICNWIVALTHLYSVEPNAERYAVFEDDLLVVSNLREYLENCEYPFKGYWNLITHPENLLLTGNKEGWHKSNQLGRGAVGLVFDRETAGQLLRAKGLTERTKYTPLPAADGMVIDSLKPLGFSEYIHFPTLIQHTGGGQSTMGHPYGEMPGWRGEEYDPRQILIKEGKQVTSHIEVLEQQTLAKMVMPNQLRPTVWFGGVMQIHVTRACDMACHHCTQGSNLAGKPVLISPEDFETACKSLKDYFGVVGMFGGNPAVHPKFEELCDIFASYFPRERRGLWCNHPKGHGKKMREVFNPTVSNLNVHLNKEAYDEFKRDWPESLPFGLDSDSRHSPPYVAMLDVIADEEERLKLIGSCDINRLWSAMICSIPGKGLRGFFCEIAGAQAILHANDEQWPDNGIPITAEDDPVWWQRPREDFMDQMRHNCHRCGVPLRRWGQLAVAGEKEEVSPTHLEIYKPKDRDRVVELVQIDNGPKLHRVTDYTKNVV